MKPDPEKCISGGCPHKATTWLKCIDGWRGRFCDRCIKKIGGGMLTPIKR